MGACRGAQNPLCFAAYTRGGPHKVARARKLDVRKSCCWNIFTQIHTRKHGPAHARMQTHACTEHRTHTPPCKCTSTHARMLSHTHKHTNTRTHTHTCTHLLHPTPFFNVHEKTCTSNDMHIKCLGHSSLLHLVSVYRSFVFVAFLARSSIRTARQQWRGLGGI